jgi:uncharacterized protein (DUF302 family)
MQTYSAFEAVVAGKVTDVEALVRTALAAEGFGVLTEIDVAGTFKAKLGIDRDALKILGACNPSFAHQALDLDPSLALVLPCNVVVEDLGGGRTRVAIADPRTMLSGRGGTRPEIDALADGVAAALEQALGRLGS